MTSAGRRTIVQLVCICICIGVSHTTNTKPSPNYNDNTPSDAAEIERQRLEALDELINLQKKRVEILTQMQQQQQQQPTQGGECEGGECDTATTSPPQTPQTSPPPPPPPPPPQPIAVDESVLLQRTVTRSLSEWLHEQPDSSLTLVASNAMTLPVPRTSRAHARKDKSDQQQQQHRFSGTQYVHVTACALSDGRVFFFDDTGHVIWDTRLEKHQRVLSMSSDTIDRGALLLFALTDGSVITMRVSAWLEPGGVVKTKVLTDITLPPPPPTGEEATVTCMTAFRSHRVTMIVVGGSDGQIRSYSGTNGELRASGDTHNSTVNAFAFNDKRSQAVFASNDGVGVYRVSRRQHKVTRFCEVANYTQHGVRDVQLVGAQGRRTLVYALTADGQLLIYRSSSRFVVAACTPLHTMTVLPNTPLSMTLMAGYVLFASNSTLLVYNITGSQIVAPEFVVETQVDGQSSRPLWVGVTAHRSQDHAIISTMANDGSLNIIRSYLPLEQEHSPFLRNFRFPIILVGIVMAVVYKVCVGRGRQIGGMGGRRRMPDAFRPDLDFPRSGRFAPPTSGGGGGGGGGGSGLSSSSRLPGLSQRHPRQSSLFTPFDN